MAKSNMSFNVFMKSKFLCFFQKSNNLKYMLSLIIDESP